MPPIDALPKDYSPELLADIEAVYTSVWKLVQPYALARNEQTTREMEIILSRTLVELVSNGITNRKELRQCALESVALAPPT
jgi:hypothetical protein